MEYKMNKEISAFNRMHQRTLSLIRKYNITIEDIVELLCALNHHTKYGKIPSLVQQKLVRYYCLSNDEVQELIHCFRCDKSDDIVNNIQLRSALFNITASDFEKVIKTVHEEGYAKMPFRLSEQICDFLVEESKGFKYDCVVRDENGMRHEKIDILKERPEATITASAEVKSLMKNKLIRDIADDNVIKSIVSILLRCKPSIHSLNFWHSYTTPNGKAESECAQEFHYDLDEFRWLKVFIFLTEVGIEDGPHIYIRGTHKVSAKPRALLNKGYGRISDEEMSRFYPKDTWQTITCKPGTIYIADTRCYHKANPVLNGKRTVLQPQYAKSDFSSRII